MRTPVIASAWVLFSLVLLSGCDDDRPPGPGSAPPAAPALTLSVTNPRELSFSWASEPAATYYRLEKSPDGVAAYTTVADHITGTSAKDTVPVHLHNWINARYRLWACNRGGCMPGPAISSESAMIDAIGYFKASNTRAVSPAYFGVVELSADGNTMVVGAHYEDSSAPGINGDQESTAAGASGAVYVFVRDGNHWTQQAYLKASNPDVLDLFGYSIAVSADGNVIAVGALKERSTATGINGDQGNDTLSSDDYGAAYVFVRNGTTWAQQAYIKASNTGAGDDFGISVALSADGHTLAVGASGEDSGFAADQSDNSVSSAGAVYVYKFSGSAWSQQAYLKAANAGLSSRFGFVVDLSADGNRLLVGAPDDRSLASGINGTSTSATQSVGGAYLFHRTGNTWTQNAYLKASASAAMDQFGLNVSVSGDGHTLAVAALRGNGSDVPVSGAGAVYVFTDATGSWAQQTIIQPDNAEFFDQFGAAFLSGNPRGIDLSADGNMLVASAPWEDGGSAGVGGDQSDNSISRSGAAYVFRRTGSAWNQVSYLKAPNPAVDYMLYGVSMTADGSMIALSSSFEHGITRGIGGDWTDQSADYTGAVYLY